MEKPPTCGRSVRFFHISHFLYGSRHPTTRVLLFFCVATSVALCAFSLHPTVVIPIPSLQQVQVHYTKSQLHPAFSRSPPGRANMFPFLSLLLPPLHYLYVVSLINLLSACSSLTSILFFIICLEPPKLLYGLLYLSVSSQALPYIFPTTLPHLIPARPFVTFDKREFLPSL